MTPQEQFAAIRAVLAGLVERQQEHEKWQHEHEKWQQEHDKRRQEYDKRRQEYDKRQQEHHQQQIEEIHAVLSEIGEIQRKQSKELFSHAKLLVEHDERMERIGRHLEVLIDIVDGLIRKPK